jgi:hypothetical protein
METLALLSEAIDDVGYTSQRRDLAGQDADRAVLARYPIILQGDVPTNARAVLYISDKGTPWSPIERLRSGDALSLHITPVGRLIERYGLERARPWLPLCIALLNGEEGWIALDADAGHVLIEGKRIAHATLKRDLPDASIDVGLHAARLGGAQRLPFDCPLLALASLQGAGEHLHLHGEFASTWSSPSGTIAFEPLDLDPPPPTPNALPFSPPIPTTRLIPERFLALWRHLVDHRYGFDLLRKGVGAPVVGEVHIALPTATLVTQWIRMKTDDAEWRTLCMERGLAPALVLPWIFRVGRYVHAFSDVQPTMAKVEEDTDAMGIQLVLSVAMHKLMIISQFRGDFVR